MRKFDSSIVTESVKTIVTNASESAKKLKNAEFTSYHLLAAILHDEEGRQIIKGAGGSPHQISKKLKVAIGNIPKDKVKKPAPSGCISKALHLAANKTKGQVGIGHVVLALYETEETRDMLESLDPERVVTTKNYGEALSNYSIDLTKLAKLGKLDPVIGRDHEIRNTIQTLSRRTKNNPVIVGESGVGKTAIVEAIAQRIAANDVPESLKGRSIIQLDIAKIVAGAQYRGQFEERLKGVIDEAIKEKNSIILFIDDLQNIMGSGKSESGQDAASILKPALARGEIRCIGCCSFDAYKKQIEKDKALERRFQPIRIEEPSTNESASILRGLRDRFQNHYGLRISDDALVSAVRLSDRYVTSKFLPDKAIDLIDQACAVLKMNIESLPTPIDERERNLKILKMEEASLTEARKERKAQVAIEIQQLEEEISSMRDRWEAERKLIDDLKKVGEKIESSKAKAQTLQNNGELQSASKLIYVDIPEMENQQAVSFAELEKIQNEGSFLRDCVLEEDVARVVSSWTGIPAEKMLQNKTQIEMLSMEDRLHESVIGQHEPIVAISKAIRQSRAGLTDPNAPVGTFLFLGPTGVGKTELAKALARFLFDDENKLVRLDMSEYMEKNSINRLIGSPPGYVGSEEGGQLTEAVRANPYSIVLLDEVEKAHPDVWNLFLQLFDEGRLTDSHGRTVDFTNTIVLMTSNIGSALYYMDLSPEELESNREALLKKHFRPEFLNRIDKVIYFHPLAREHMMKILNIQLRSVQKRLKEKGLVLDLSEDAKEWLCEHGYQPEMGARPLKRLIKENVLDPLSDYILTKAPSDETVQMDVTDGKFYVK